MQNANNTLLSDSLSRKNRPVWQVLITFGLTAVFVIASVVSPAAFAGAVQLSDDELDGVYAEGFSVKFDVSAAPVQNLAKNQPSNSSTALNIPTTPTKSSSPALNLGPIAPSPKTTITSTGGNLFSMGNSGMNAVLVEGKSQQFLSSLININAAGSVVPVMFNLMVNINSKVQNATQENNLDMKNSYNIKVPASALSNTSAPVSQSQTSQPATQQLATTTPTTQSSIAPSLTTPTIPTPNSSSSPQAPGAGIPAGLNLNPLTTSSNASLIALPTSQGTTNTSGASSSPDASLDIQPMQMVSTEPLASGVGSGGLNINGAQNVSAPASTSSLPGTSSSVPLGSPSQNVSPITSDTLGSPTTSNTDPSVPPTTGQINGALADNPISIGTTSIAPGTGGTNMVIVGDQAQQNLSSFVNVNAAGSVVPILINFVININSQVNNLSNSNKLNLEDSYRFQIN